MFIWICKSWQQMQKNCITVKKNGTLLYLLQILNLYRFHTHLHEFVSLTTLSTLFYEIFNHMCANKIQFYYDQQRIIQLSLIDKLNHTMHSIRIILFGCLFILLTYHLNIDTKIISFKDYFKNETTKTMNARLIEVPCKVGYLKMNGRCRRRLK